MGHRVYRFRNMGEALIMQLLISGVTLLPRSG
jgi:hypothetical protein